MRSTNADSERPLKTSPLLLKHTRFLTTRRDSVPTFVLRWAQSEMVVFWQNCTMSGHSGAVYAVAFSPSGNSILSGAADNLVKIWEVKTGAEVRNLVGVT